MEKNNISRQLSSTEEEYDQRQYRLMEERMLNYERGEITLNTLIVDLEVLLGVLHMDDEEWKQSFRSAWWILEEVYAVALDRERDTLSLEDRELIKKSIDKLRQLLASKIIEEGTV
ncbi:MAG: hypothetical protein UW40_C0038G0002 [Parcubacteria group bacterium GW2011_GWF2_44_17]|nr:MAG: hypothetical protein UW40_C0038G0002 [Parcubacteria group bacterium GW2011_GWF2_44_17]